MSTKKREDYLRRFEEWRRLRCDKRSKALIENKNKSVLTPQPPDQQIAHRERSDTFTVKRPLIRKENRAPNILTSDARSVSCKTHSSNSTVIGQNQYENQVSTIDFNKAEQTLDTPEHKKDLHNKSCMSSTRIHKPARNVKNLPWKETKTSQLRRAAITDSQKLTLKFNPFRDSILQYDYNKNFSIVSNDSKTKPGLIKTHQNCKRRLSRSKSLNLKNQRRSLCSNGSRGTLPWQRSSRLNLSKYADNQCSVSAAHNRRKTTGPSFKSDFKDRMGGIPDIVKRLNLEAWNTAMGHTPFRRRYKNCFNVPLDAETPPQAFKPGTKPSNCSGYLSPMVDETLDLNVSSPNSSGEITFRSPRTVPRVKRHSLESQHMFKSSAIKFCIQEKIQLFQRPKTPTTPPAVNHYTMITPVRRSTRKSLFGDSMYTDQYRIVENLDELPDSVKSNAVFKRNPLLDLSPPGL